MIGFICKGLRFVVLLAKGLPTRRTANNTMKTAKTLFLAILLCSSFICGWMLGHQCRLPFGINKYFDVNHLRDRLAPHDLAIISMSANGEGSAMQVRINNFEHSGSLNVEKIDKYIGSNSSVTVYTYLHGQWTRDRGTCQSAQEAEMRIVNLKTTSGINTPIAIHDPLQDVYVSGNIALSGSWEWSLVQQVMNALQKSPDAYLIDIGSNIGNLNNLYCTYINLHKAAFTL